MVCFGERPCQLLAEVTGPPPAEPGKVERFDYEYERRGMAYLFMTCERLTDWRRVEASERLGQGVRPSHALYLAEEAYPRAEKLRVVCDYLSAHTQAAFYDETFSPGDPGEKVRKIELVYTPVHGSWLNMAEIENSVLVRQCPGRRSADIETLGKEAGAWQKGRNRLGRA